MTHRTAAPTLRDLQGLTHDEALRALRSAPESQWFDRKSGRIHPRELADTMIAFANAEGGLIAVGIENDGRVLGVSVEATNRLRQTGRDLIEPVLTPLVDELSAPNTPNEDEVVLLIEVPPSEVVHRRTSGEVFVRIGDRDRRLNPMEAIELSYDRGQASFDGVAVPGANVNDLDDVPVQRFVATLRSRLPAPQALIARGLLLARNDEFVPTTAGMLIFGREPQRFFPEAYIRVLKYAGASREVGPALRVLADRRCEGTIPQQIVAARSALRRLLPTVERLGPQGRFVSATLVPEFVWLEAIVNAVVHRSYSLSGDHVRVEIFDDRVEVTSPGRFPGLVRPDNIRSTRFARNPRIARVMTDLEYARELGEGVNRMFAELASVGLPDPVFQELDSAVRVTFLLGSAAAAILRTLPPGSERFVDHLMRFGRLTTTEAVSLMGLSRPTVLAQLNRLKSLGLLEHIGSSSKDPRGYWRLVRAVAGSHSSDPPALANMPSMQEL